MRGHPRGCTIFEGRATNATFKPPLPSLRGLIRLLSLVKHTHTYTHARTHARTHHVHLCRVDLKQGFGSVATACAYCHALASGRELPRCNGCRKQPRPRFISYRKGCELLFSFICFNTFTNSVSTPLNVNESNDVSDKLQPRDQVRWPIAIPRASGRHGGPVTRKNAGGSETRPPRPLPRRRRAGTLVPR